MVDTLKRWFSTARIWLGWGDIADSRLSPAHGWLLPALARVRQTPRESILPEATLGPRYPGVGREGSERLK